MSGRLRLALATLAFGCASPVLNAQPAQTPNDARPHAVALSPAAPVARFHDVIQGSESVEYTFAARKGDVLFADLQTKVGALNFNVWPPGPRGSAVHRGDVDGAHWTAVAAADGDYTVSVYVMRNVARRGGRRPFALSIGRTSPPAGVPRANDARVKGTPFHAVSSVRCQLTAGSSMMQCPLGVIRGAHGVADLHISTPDGARRVFRVTATRVTDLEPSHRVRAEHAGDLWTVVVDGTERYEIPDAAVVGG